MTEQITQLLGIVQIILQLVAVYYAYKLTKITGTFTAWALIIIGLSIMTLRRITAQLIIMNIIPSLEGTIGLIDRLLLPLTISVCIMLGMYELYKIFKRRVKQ
jgi:hypothetical protein